MFGSILPDKNTVLLETRGEKVSMKMCMKYITREPKSQDQDSSKHTEIRVYRVGNHFKGQHEHRHDRHSVTPVGENLSPV